MSIIGAIIQRMTERQARGKSYGDFHRALAKTGETVHGRFLASEDTPGHREAGQHVIGIERWSQSRLRVALGEPFKRDEYDSYRPADDLNVAALAQSFADTRAETGEIADQLEAASVPLSRTVPHNDLGDLTIGGWFSYIISHAGRESRRL